MFTAQPTLRPRTAEDKVVESWHIPQYLYRRKSTSRSYIKTTDWVELVFGMGAFFHCVRRKFGYLQKITVLPSRTLSQTLAIENFAFAHRSLKRYRASSTKVGAQSMTNWTVISQTIPPS